MFVKQNIKISVKTKMRRVALSRGNLPINN